MRDASSKASNKTVHAHYTKYCETNGVVVIHYPSFCKLTKELGFKETRKTVGEMRAQYIRGFKCRTPRT